MRQKLRSLSRRLLHALTRPAAIISIIGIVGFAIDMLVKPISNAGLILLLAASSPWILKTVKRLKVGDYLEFESLSPSEAQRKLQAEAEELLAESVEPSTNTKQIDDVEGEPPPAPRIAEGALAITPDMDNVLAAMRGINLTERLVLDWLEGQLGVTVRRNVRLGNLELDGLAFTKPVPTLIEIKALNSSPNLSRRLRSARATLNGARREWVHMRSEEPRLLLILTTTSQPGEAEYNEILKSLSAFDHQNVSPIDVKLVSATDIGLHEGWLTTINERNAEPS